VSNGVGTETRMPGGLDPVLVLEGRSLGHDLSPLGGAGLEAQIVYRLSRSESRTT